MSRAKATSALAVLALALAGCDAPGAGDGTFPEEPLATVTSGSGALTVELRTSPQPPERGIITAQLTFLGAGGEAPGDLTLDVLPWMPSMGHGTSTEPTIVPVGQGVYRVEQIGLFMPGLWELRTSVSGAVTDDVVLPLQIP